MSASPILDIRRVWKRFGGLFANSDISLKVERGELVGLIGPNGAGKSTLFNVIAGVYPPSEGTIIFDDENITTLPATGRCSRGIARTFQVVRSFESMSVLDNVIVGGLVRTSSTAEARRKALEVLDFTELKDQTHALANELTPAQKRRLEVARALATRPKLLLLDEVLTGLTPTEARRGVELVRRIRESGVTVVMVEHVMEIVMPLVDRVVVLDLGRVLHEGRPEEVVHNENVIRAYFGERHRAANA
jgi:branched-chain amino acid transport system ATP-binding protein